MLKKPRFRKIKKAYEEREKDFREKGIAIDRPTKKGLFSPSDMEEVFRIFREIIKICQYFISSPYPRLKAR